MSAADFQAELDAAGLSQAQLRHLVERLTGQPTDRGTTSRWVRGIQAPSPYAVALVRLFARLPEPERHRLLQKPKRAAAAE